LTVDFSIPVVRRVPVPDFQKLRLCRVTDVPSVAFLLHCFFSGTIRVHHHFWDSRFYRLSKKQKKVFACRRFERCPNAVYRKCLPDKAHSEILFVECLDRKSTRLNSSHVKISYAVFCLKKKRTTHQ